MAVDAQRVLVTGGAGFIGVNLAPQLHAAGWSTRCFDNFSSGHREDVARAGYDDVVEGDIRDGAALSEAAQGCSLVVHLAGQAGIPTSLSDPHLDEALNVQGTLNALIAARDAGVRAFVLASSSAPLGDVDPPASERVVPRPKSPYGASKLAAEAYCSAFSGSWNLPTVALRFSNVYGPYSYHKGSVVAAFMKSAVNGQPLVIYGDGEQTRDFTYVGDICSGIVGALSHTHGGVVAHLGTGRGTRVIDVAHTIMAQFADRELVIEHREPRAGDVAHSYVDTSLAHELFGYAPETALDAGIAETARWFRAASHLGPSQP